MLQLRRAAADGGGGVRVEGKIQLSCQPQPAEKPERVLIEPAVRVAHTADQPGFQIGLSAEQVHQTAGLPGHGVDSEVPAGQVLGQIVGKLHPVRVAVVGVGPLPAKGGHLYREAVGQNGNSAVFQAGLQTLQSGTGGLNLRREGRGSGVIVVGRKTQQAVPDAASYQYSAVAGSLQPAQYRKRPRIPNC